MHVFDFTDSSEEEFVVVKPPPYALALERFNGIRFFGKLRARRTPAWSEIGTRSHSVS